MHKRFQTHRSISQLMLCATKTSILCKIDSILKSTTLCFVEQNGKWKAKKKEHETWGFLMSPQMPILMKIIATVITLSERLKYANVCIADWKKFYCWAFHLSDVTRIHIFNIMMIHIWFKPKIPNFYFVADTSLMFIADLIPLFLFCLYFRLLYFTKIRFEFGFTFASTTFMDYGHL